MTNNHFTPSALAILASISLAACSSSGSDQVVIPADVTTPAKLPTDVTTTLTLDEEALESGIAVTSALVGAQGSPVVSETTYTVDGKSYTLIDPDNPEAQRGDLFATEVASVDGVKAFGAGEFGILNEKGSDVDRIDILFSATPTDTANLPTSTASYTGTYDAVFYDIQDQETNSDSGLFNATADFGAAQSLTGSFNAENADGSAGEQHAILTADINGNGFVGTVETDDGAEIDAGGYFTGDNASGLVGAAVGTFVHSEDESEEALIVFQATAE